MDRSEAPPQPPLSTGGMTRTEDIHRCRCATQHPITAHHGRRSRFSGDAERGFRPPRLPHPAGVGRRTGPGHRSPRNGSSAPDRHAHAAADGLGDHPSHSLGNLVPPCLASCFPRGSSTSSSPRKSSPGRRVPVSRETDQLSRDHWMSWRKPCEPRSTGRKTILGVRRLVAALDFLARCGTRRRSCRRPELKRKRRPVAALQARVSRDYSSTAQFHPQSICGKDLRLSFPQHLASERKRASVRFAKTANSVYFYRLAAHK